VASTFDARARLDIQAAGRKHARCPEEHALIPSATRSRRAVSEAPTRKLTRAEQRDLTRKSLIDAACDVVGNHGYLGATVTAITRRAGVAQGTFYNYFESREDLFDQLLPALSGTMFDHIRAAAQGARSEQAREEASMRAYFDFLHRVPAFYRILYESETFAPTAYRANIDMIARNYARVLQRARADGKIVAFTRRELEPIVYMLMGARHYLSMRHQRRGRLDRPVPDWVVKAYMKLIRGLYLP
jgi:AcrR family transcriptional regulator